MHFVSFAAKRAYYATLRTGRVLARHFDLTPARFDILLAVGRLHRGRLRQSRLRGMLGIARSTLSTMLKRMEALGLVRREQSEVDGRTLDVLITAEGYRRFRRAERDICGRGYLSNAYEAFIGRTRGIEHDFAIEVEELWARLRWLAEHFGDSAWLRYPTDLPD
jgi:hypothetical protein